MRQLPVFVTECKRKQTASIQVVQEAFVHFLLGKMEKLARSLGSESLFCSYISEITKGLNEQVNAFHGRSLSQSSYPV